MSQPCSLVSGLFGTHLRLLSGLRVTIVSRLFSGNAISSQQATFSADNETNYHPFRIPAFAAARQEKAHFSDLLEATGVYHEGDKAPRPTTYRPPFKMDSVTADDLEVGLITKELNKKTATAQSDKGGRKKEFYGKDTDVAQSDEPTSPAGDTRIHIGH